MPGYFCYTPSSSPSPSVSHPLSLRVFEDTADRQVCPHSWCLAISLLLFHLCYCFPLLTFQTNLVWQTDHRCPLDSSPLSEAGLAADLLFFVSSQIPMILFVVVVVVVCLFWLLSCILHWAFLQCCYLSRVRIKEETGGPGSKIQPVAVAALSETWNWNLKLELNMGTWRTGQGISTKYWFTSRKQYISSKRMRGASSAHPVSLMLLIPADASRLF